METIQVKTKPCFGCREPHYLEVLLDDYNRWMNGAYVQVAFPEMPAAQREMLVSGTCPECWDKMFSDDEDY